MFNLFILDYFGLFSFGFRLSVHLNLTSKSGDQKLFSIAYSTEFQNLLKASIGMEKKILERSGLFSKVQEPSMTMHF